MFLYGASILLHNGPRLPQTTAPYPNTPSRGDAASALAQNGYKHNPREAPPWDDQPPPSFALRRVLTPDKKNMGSYPRWDLELRLRYIAPLPRFGRSKLAKLRVFIDCWSYWFKMAGWGYRIISLWSLTAGSFQFTSRRPDALTWKSTARTTAERDTPLREHGTRKFRWNW